jgi:hypothetical protein
MHFARAPHEEISFQTAADFGSERSGVAFLPFRRLSLRRKHSPAASAAEASDSFLEYETSIKVYP